MTATSIVRKLQKQFVGTGDVVTITELTDALRFWKRWQPGRYRAAWVKWEQDIGVIADCNYSRDRDQIRAYRRRDLQLAVDLDQIGRPK